MEFGGGGITIARNVLAGIAIREKYDVLLFVAADIGFKDNKMSDAVRRILSHFEKPAVNIVGGVYLFKRFPLQIVAAQDEDRGIDEDGLIEVNRTGTDFLAIRVSALNEIIDAWPNIEILEYDCERGREWNLFGQCVVATDNGNRFLPEDFYFCHIAKQAGFQILIDSQIRLQHWGQHNYDANGVTGIETALTLPNPEPQYAATP